LLLVISSVVKSGRAGRYNDAEQKNQVHRARPHRCVSGVESGQSEPLCSGATRPKRPLQPG